MAHTSQEKSSGSGSSDAPTSDAQVSGKQIDPVCGMTVEPEHARAELTFEQKRYYFCSQGCATKFGANPASYLSPQSGAAAAAVTVSVPVSDSETRAVDWEGEDE